MPSLNVPEEHISGLARIIRLSAEEAERVVAALEKAKSLSRNALIGLTKSALPEFNGDEAKEVVETLLSLYSARTGMDTPVESFVLELLNAAKRVDVDVPQSTDVLNKNLKSLLSVRPLSMLSKARGIHTDHENTYCTARILTDLRAVFDVDVKEDPVGFVMAHILHLGYHHAGEHAHIHIAMDRLDIDNLINVLQRAKAKAATLTATMTEKSGFPILAE